MDLSDNACLTDLVQYLQDSRNGYKDCANRINSELLKNLFIRCSEKRNRMINDLKKLATNPQLFKEDGTLSGKAHQLFVNLKGLITGGNVDSIIREIKRGENLLIENYRKILRTELAFNLKTMLNDQLLEIENDLSEIDRFSC